MPEKKIILPSLHLIRRKTAEKHLLLTLLCFAGSVAVTRLFLSLTGYPQIGGGELHIAHVLWGGILLYLAVIIILVFSNQGVYVSSSILAGLGVGLFIDEIGKFITQSNDYFYPVAAPLIYILFLFSLLVLLRVRYLRSAHKGGALSLALHDIAQSFEKKFSKTEWMQMRSELSGILDLSSSPEETTLARALVGFVEAHPDKHLKEKKSEGFFEVAFSRVTAFLLAPGQLKVLLILGMIGIGLLMWKNPATVISNGWIGGSVGPFLESLHFGREVVELTALDWFKLRVGLEVAVGLMLLLSAILLAVKRDRAGVAFGIVGLLVSLSTVDLLLFYFEQFSTIITTTIQFLLLFGLYRYRDGLKT